MKIAESELISILRDHAEYAQFTLDWYARSSVNLKELVELNPKTPVEFLKILAKDDDYRIRADVATNRNTPIEILQILAKDGVIVEDNSVEKRIPLQMKYLRF